MPPAAARDANWIDGLRGCASFVVVTGHLCTAFAPYLHSPAMGEDLPPTLFQYPFLRLVVGGRSAVALFFLVTGYVNSISPIAKSRAGNTDAAFHGIAKSALARSGRLVLPTVIATVFSWLLAQLGGYSMGEHVDATWIRQGWHGRATDPWTAIESLVHAVIETWTVGWDEYDGTQWTLILFLEGAFMVYMTMVATVLVTPFARKAIIWALWVYSWLGGQALKSMNVFFGMFVAELHADFGAEATNYLPMPVPSLMMIVGLFLCGYPQDAAELAGWSRAMSNILLPITPKEADIRRYWDSIGACILLLGIFFSKNARRVLTSPSFNFLGRVSFPVYLLHNQLIKTLMTWMIYLPSAMHPTYDDQGQQKDLERGPPLQFAVAIPVFYYILYRLAHLWVLYIDPLCARLTNWAVKKAMGGASSEKPILIQ
ncbi:hypothetical protein B0A49_06918 [Cryomyces minteri]|uniref:Acyltransferase 3 domain-containing protein n=1 Tax=Cryomyces minteri TaxID=331657 RepID=A0A4U0XGY5_9PEZI|nr:hypothetical protein B0A49_06918 [Cryomyces minteri]